MSRGAQAIHGSRRHNTAQARQLGADAEFGPGAAAFRAAFNPIEQAARAVQHELDAFVRAGMHPAPGTGFDRQSPRPLNIAALRAKFLQIDDLLSELIADAGHIHPVLRIYGVALQTHLELFNLQLMQVGRDCYLDQSQQVELVSQAIAFKADVNKVLIEMDAFESGMAVAKRGSGGDE